MEPTELLLAFNILAAVVAGVIRFLIGTTGKNWIRQHFGHSRMENDIDHFTDVRYFHSPRRISRRPKRHQDQQDQHHTAKS